MTNAMTFPCGKQELDPDQMTRQDHEALAIHHGWTKGEEGWVHADRPDYLYDAAESIVDDWSLWQNPDLVTAPTPLGKVDNTLEDAVISDYRALVGKVILVDKIEGYKGDEYMSIDLGTPVFARVVSYTDSGVKNDVTRWMDEWIDPVYSIKMLPGSELPEVETTHTYGKSYATNGEIAPAHFVVPSDDFVARHVVEGGAVRQIEMKLFEVTLEGFDGGTDETDDLVVWIAAPEGKVVEDAIANLGAQFCGEVSADLEAADFILPRDNYGLYRHILEAKPELEAAPAPKM